ncbi:MAG: site-specific integrase, partial [Erysipelotrichaceae bacterium]|nr:site-specific integrase [Erysipelotrichaceae bacterium]
MDKIIDDFIASLKVTRSGSKATMDAYARDINRLAVFLETKGIDDFNRVDKFVAMEYLNYLRSGNITEKKISNATYARSLSALRSFYR